MIDVRLIRENPKILKDNIKKKFQNHKLKIVDEVKKKDEEWRKIKSEIDFLRADRNKVSKEISSLKKSGKSVSVLMKKAKEIPEKIFKLEEKSGKLEEEIKLSLRKIPNIMHESVPRGKDASQNVVAEVIGKPNKIDFEIKNHAELGEKFGLLNFEESAKTSGNGFYYIYGDLALLNQALIQFALDKMLKGGYVYMETPLMLRGEVIKNVTDLNDQKNQIYKIEGEDLYLIGTSEHSMIGRYINTMFMEKNLPIKNTSYSMCFRKEIGSHGIDEKGIFRTHQFNKVEMVVICKPEESMNFFDEMKSITIDIFKSLGIPIRILNICSGDLGDLKHIQVDIEAWSPRKNEYYEVGSCSNLTDAQARKLKIRVLKANGERYIPHTLNNTAIATSRALVAIMENNQQKDGRIKIPDALVKYMNGKKFIEKRG